MSKYFPLLQYAEKLFVRRIKDNQHHTLVAQRVWESVRINDKKGVYRYIVNSDVGVNSIRGKASFGTIFNSAKVVQFQLSIARMRCSQLFFPLVFFLNYRGNHR